MLEDHNIIEKRISDVLEKMSGTCLSVGSAQKVIDACGINGLTVDDVLSGVTPSGIMDSWLRHRIRMPELQSLQEQELVARKKNFPLLPYSQLVFEMMHEISGIYDFSLCIRFDQRLVDVRHLEKSVTKAVNNHPALLSQIDQDGIQHFAPDVKNPYFHIDVREEEGSVLLTVRINRILGDGTSFQLLLEDILKAYEGIILKPDYYFSYLNKVEEHKKSEEYKKHKYLLEEEYGTITCPVRPHTDIPLDTEVVPVAGMFADEYLLSVSGESYSDGIEQLAGSEHISPNAFFSLCAALAIMDYENTDEAALTWAYLGRDTLEEQSIFGSLHKDIPMKISRYGDRKLLMRQARDQIRSGIAHSDYPLTLTAPYNQVWNYAVNVLQQPNLNAVYANSPFPFEVIEPHSDAPSIAYSLLDVEIEMADNGTVRLVYKYSATHYKEESIRRFARLVRRNADWLLGFHHPITRKLMDMFDADDWLRDCMEQSLEKSATMCPDKRMNPVRTVDDLQCFLDRFLTSMPWQSLGLGKDMSMFRRMDQSTGYFLFLFDQPLDALNGLGYLYPSIQYVPCVAAWIKEFNNAWREFLDSTDSWNDDYYKEIASDGLFGLDKGWYESKENWHTWNEFFARRLRYAEARPAGNAAVVAPADGILQPCVQIDSDSRLVVPDCVALKTSSVRSVADLLGESPYRNDFAGGCMVHQMLDFYDYHRMHSPVDGTIVDIRVIDGCSGSGGVVIWDEKRKRYAYDNPNELGFQMIETRGVLVIDTEGYGKVAVVPVGMAQVCSVNWTDGLEVGKAVRKGDELGYFLCGGSNVVLLFQKDRLVSLSVEPGGQILTGTNLALLYE